MPGRLSRIPWARLRRIAIHYGAVPLVAVLGGAIGLALVPATTVDVGPLTASVHLRPSLRPQTVILLPPVGEVSFATHVAPVRVEARVRNVDISKAEDLLYSDEALHELEQSAPDAIAGAAIENAGLNALFAVLGASGAVALTFRRVRRSVIAGGTALVLTAGSSGLVWATFKPEALYQPSFDGLLSQATYIADLGDSTLANYSSYRSTLAEFVGQVSALYIAADSLPGNRTGTDVVRVLHVSDIHDNPQAFDMIKQLDQQFDLDLVIDTGDIVSWGTPVEHQQLSTIRTLGVPYVFIKGNHDSAETSAAVAENPNAHVLENEVITIDGIEIAGIGDPRFAADDDSDTTGFAEGKEAVANAGFQLGETVETYDEKHADDPVDVALIHDPTQPAGLEGRVPLVLSGHMHTSKVELDRDESGTDWLTVGSTGGALASGGVRPVLDGKDPLDLSARMLYFDRQTSRLIAYDDITMGGLGLVSVSIQRHQLPTEEAPLEVPEDARTPSAPVPSEQEVSPGKGLEDEDRVTPESPRSPAPSSSDPETSTTSPEPAGG